MNEPFDFFDYLDDDNDGYITAADIRNSIDKIENLPLGANEIIHELMEGRRKRISREDYDVQIKKVRDKMKFIYNQMDLDQSKYLSFDEVKQGLKIFFSDVKIPKTELKYLYDKVDRDKDNKINFTQFIEFLGSLPSKREHLLLDNMKRAALILNFHHETEPIQYIAEDLKATQMHQQHKIRNFIFALTACALAKTATAPLDRVRLLFQVNVLKYKNATQGLYTLYQWEGFRGLFKGNSVNLLRSVPSFALRIYIYEHLLDYFRSRNQKENLSNFETLAAGSIATSISTLMFYPLEVLKIHMQIGKGTANQNFILTARNMYRDQGFKVFLTGSKINILYLILQSGLNLESYQTIQDIVAMTTPLNMRNAATISGVLGMMFSQTIFYPLQFLNVGYILNKTYFKRDITNWGLAKEFYQADGIKHFYRGYGINIFKGSAGQGLSIFFYSMMKDLSHKFYQSQQN